MTTKQVREKLSGLVDSVSQKNGVFTVRRGFFYTHGGSAERLAAAVKAAFPDATVLDSGEKWTSFRGGATVANQSHWWVKFQVEPTCIAPATY
jgi:hypothetical protein